MNFNDRKWICGLSNFFFQDWKCIWKIADTFLNSQMHLPVHKCICKMAKLFARLRMHLYDRKCHSKFAKSFAWFWMHLQDCKIIWKIWTHLNDLNCFLKLANDHECICKIPNLFTRLHMHLHDRKCFRKFANAFAWSSMH